MTRKIIPARHPWRRLLASFKRLFEKPRSRQEKPVYKRDFNRFPMDLAVMVDLPDENGGICSGQGGVEGHFRKRSIFCFHDAPPVSG
jgi:hypothetical protein